jgi:hypothetical protein
MARMAVGGHDLQRTENAGIREKNDEILTTHVR